MRPWETSVKEVRDSAFQQHPYTGLLDQSPATAARFSNSWIYGTARKEVMPPRNTKRCISSTKRRRNAWGIWPYLFGIHAKTAIRRIGVTKNSFSIMPNGSVKFMIYLRFIIINLPCKALLFAHCSFAQWNNSKQTRFS